MKKIFTLLLSASCFAATAQSPFQATSVVVYRVGDGSSTLRGVATKVFLDEFSPSGTLIQSVAMPSTPAGSNVALTAAGSATAEGLLTRSVDGSYLMLGGYNTDTGTTGLSGTTATAVKRVVGRVDRMAAMNITTQLGVTSFSGNGIRGVASTDGSNFWATGAGSGVRYGMLGDTSTRVNAFPGISNFRAVEIFGGQLYVSTVSGTAVRIGTVGTGLPIDTGNVVTPLAGFPLTVSPNQFFFADLNPAIPGLDVLYVADDGSTAAGVQKYSFDGTNWVSNGLAVPAVTGARGLTATVTGGVVTLYVTASGTKLYSLVDNTGYNATIATNFTELASAATNTAFRGVALAPQNVITPLKLVSFKAILTADGSKLNWTSANELNVKDFTIERSIDGKEFAAIGNVSAQNRNEAAYSFIDKTPYEGVNYYRLKMNDADGSFKYSPVATVVNRHGGSASAFPNPAANNITISHSKAVSGATISITTASGQLVKTAIAETGAVQTTITIDKLVRGHYIVLFNNNGEKSVTRFMKQ